MIHLSKVFQYLNGADRRGGWGLMSREIHPFSRYPNGLNLYQLKFHPQPPDIKPRSRPDGFDVATYNFLCSEEHDGFPNTLTSRASTEFLLFPRLPMELRLKIWKDALPG